MLPEPTTIDTDGPLSPSDWAGDIPAAPDEGTDGPDAATLARIQAADALYLAAPTLFAIMAEAGLSLQAVMDLMVKADPGYDQGQRWTYLVDGKIVPRKECDCSSSVAGIVRLAGYPIDLSGTVYTGNLLTLLYDIGWDVLRFPGLPKVKSADILVAPGHHTVIARTGGASGKWWSANSDERGKSSGGKAGDQTGQETGYRKAYTRPGGWPYLARHVSVNDWKGRILAAVEHGTDYSHAVSVTIKRAGYDGPLWKTFLSTWASWRAGMTLATDPAALTDIPDTGHAFVVLGSKLKPDGSLDAKGLRRIKLALAGLQQHPGSRVLLSGGKPYSGITEADAMKSWLVGQGIEPARILTEDTSQATTGNALKSIPALRAAGVTSYTLVSDASHIDTRAAVLFAAAQLQIETAENVRIGLTPLTPLVYPDTGTKASRAEVVKETAYVLGLTQQWKTAR